MSKRSEKFFFRVMQKQDFKMSSKTWSTNSFCYVVEYIFFRQVKCDLQKKYAAMFPVKQLCFNKFSDVYNFMNNTAFALNSFSPKQKSDTVFCTTNKFVEVCSRFCKHISWSLFLKFVYAKALPSFPSFRHYRHWRELCKILS